MSFRKLLCVLLAVGLAGCQAPYKKKDEADQQLLKDQSGDTAFQAFVGRLRTAVAKRDKAVLASIMTANFGYRWDTPPPGDTAFFFWDQNNLWPELEGILKAKFVPHELYMVAPPQVVTDPNYQGYRVGIRVINGSWKFAYFVPGEEAGQ